MSVNEMITEELENLKSELSKLNGYTKELEKAKIASEASIELSNKLSASIEAVKDQFDEEVSSLISLRTEVASTNGTLDGYADVVTKINFPERLTAIQSNFSGLEQKLKEINSGLKTLEASIKVQLGSLSKELRTTIKESSENNLKVVGDLLVQLESKHEEQFKRIQKQNRQNKVIGIIAIAFVISLGLIVYLKF